MKQHFFTFMGKVFSNNHAEEAPPLLEGEECWYLPLFEVYHPKNPGTYEWFLTLVLIMSVSR